LSFSQFLYTCQQRVNQRLDELISDRIPHKRLEQAIRYSLMNGGKRLRPALTYASAYCFADIKASIDSVAAAVECIHAYSLIHDDLPAMDNDDLRRGIPTCHKAFDEATAILAGDALQALAFECLASIDNLDAAVVLNMVRRLATAAGGGGMVAGQSIDLAAVKQQLSLQELEQMHNYKTGALIAVSIYLGATAVMASEKQHRALEAYAQAIGLAYQVQDDILDTTADTITLGKRQGADKALDKPTYVSLLGLNQSKQKAQSLYEQSLDAISEFDDRADHLRQLSGYIINREY
jgi:geranylgeranyl diphosphate synthase, type II